MPQCNNRIDAYPAMVTLISSVIVGPPQPSKFFSPINTWMCPRSSDWSSSNNSGSRAFSSDGSHAVETIALVSHGGVHSRHGAQSNHSDSVCVNSISSAFVNCSNSRG